MKILITGGAGFIGSNLIAYHLQKQDEVIAVDDLSTGNINNIEAFKAHPKFKFYHENLLTWSGLGKLLNQVDRVYHLAAMVGLFRVLSDPLQTLKTNINITFRVLDIIHQQSNKPLVVIASSSEVYGNQHGALRETNHLIIEDTLKGHAAYSVSKLCDESIAYSYYQQHGIPYIILRLFNTIGINQSGQYGMVVPRFIKQAVHGQEITVYGDGQQKRSFCDVKDMVRLMDEIASVPKAVGEIFNAGNSQSISIIKLAKLIKSLSGSDSKIRLIPFKEVYSDNYIQIQERKPELSKILCYIKFQFEWKLVNTLEELIIHEQNKKH
ncbi:NAD-dependent epimerase/dehydratase family protein [Legionella yabuuchiae]|uniref:NAD-dependent epimerase/dehydratase family protein n=1 Tax=Legionella yabuuchiae TaxID=376727 RepID=UPI001055DF1B|nr:NAD-dependent epimerase/dehydratase family protein [Legionella yabuuchiae]